MLLVEHKKDLRETYIADRIAELLKVTYKVNYSKDLKIKTWSEIEENFNKPLQAEKTAVEIEQEVIKKFEEWR